MRKDTLPVWNNRELVGYARNIASAEKLLREALGIPKMFTLYVSLRSEIMQDILQLPPGFVYSVFYKG